jgi:hypothetical protein
MDLNELFDAIEKNDKALWHSYLVSDTFDLNQTAENGMTALHVASVVGNLEFVKALLETNKIDVQRRYEDGHTVLDYAIYFAQQNGKGNVLELLQGLVLIPSDKIDKIVDKFSSFGRLSEQEVALCFCVKDLTRKKRNEEFNGFAFYKDELKILNEHVKKMIEENESFEFQAAIKIGGGMNEATGHWMFGSFRYDSGTKELKIILCDPLYPEKFEEHNMDFLQRNGFFINDLNKNGSTTLYISEDRLQRRETGCSYFAMDGCFMLSNQSVFEDAYQYMHEHSSKQVGNVFYGKLPPRLIRNMQSLNSDPRISDIEKDEKLRASVVNRKGEDFSTSLNKYVRPGPGSSSDFPYYINARLDAKRTSLKKKVEEYLRTLQTENQLRQSISAHRIEGFVEKFNIDKPHPKLK